MHDDAQVVRTALAHIPGPVVVVAHSYGGIPVTQAVGSAENVTHVVYLSAFMLDVHESLLAAIDESAPEDLSGVVQMTSERRAALYSDVTAALTDWAISRLVPQSLRSFAETVTRAGWREIPSTYIVCANDQSVPLVLQESFAARAGNVARIASGHSPFLSMPGELAELIGEIALPFHEVLEPYGPISRDWPLG
jgi:pimeloyl-ACP methyl ester carboxylesterase